jgi:putative membrane protein insertion efficiency factor
MTALVLGLLAFYKTTISPAWPSACKFYPSCSAYAAEAVSRYGPLRGLYMAASRVIRCRPFHPGGIDPVP